MVRKPLANGSQTKCAYVWMGLRTCATPSANGSHTIHHEPKFVSFLNKHKENWMRRVSFPCTRCLLPPEVRGKLINHVPLICRTQMAQHVSGTLVYTQLITLEWESRFTLGLNVAKNIDYIEKRFKRKLRKIKFPTKNLVEAYLYLPLEWS